MKSRGPVGGITNMNAYTCVYIVGTEICVYFLIVDFSSVIRIKEVKVTFGNYLLFQEGHCVR